MVFTPSAIAVIQQGIVLTMFVHHLSIHLLSAFQLSLVTIVSRAFILYCMVMVTSKGHLRCWQSWIQNGWHPDCKTKISDVLSFVSYFYITCMPFGFRGQGITKCRPSWIKNDWHRNHQKWHSTSFPNMLPIFTWITLYWIWNFKAQYIN